MKYTALALLLLAAACKDTTEPAVARTVDEARARMDAALVDLSWAQQDCWALGCRDVAVSVQLDSSLAPHYFRLPRK